MATKKPRVAVTLNPSTYEVIKALAELQERSPGAVISEYLEVVEEPLRNLVALLQTAKEGPDKFKFALAGVLAQQQREIDHGIDEVMGELFDGKGDSTPPQGNTGVRSVDNPKSRRKPRGPKS